MVPKGCKERFSVKKRKKSPTSQGESQTSYLVSAERIEGAIFFLRGQKVLLDKDLAELYAVSVSGLNEAVKRNRD